jgi:hypothetical protein
MFCLRVIDGNKDLVVQSIHEALAQGASPMQYFKMGSSGEWLKSAAFEEENISFPRCWWQPVR